MPPKSEVPKNIASALRLREETGRSIKGYKTPPGSPRQNNTPPSPPPPPRKKRPLPMKKGGEVKKTGVYYVHKNEMVIPASRVKSVDKVLKKEGLKPLKK